MGNGADDPEHSFCSILKNLDSKIDIPYCILEERNEGCIWIEGFVGGFEILNDKFIDGCLD